MIALLRTRRWIAFTILVIAVVVTFGLLSQWQWHRAEERDAQRRDLLTHTGGPARDLTGVLAMAPADLPALEWSPLEVTGSYEPNQYAVRRRPLDGRNGFWVLSRMTTTFGAVWINRGWLPAEGDALAMPRLPDPPQGEVQVRGFYRQPEPTEPAQWKGLPPGMIPAIAPDHLAEPAALPGYLQLVSSQPEQQNLVILPLPDIDPSRNTSYAVQWVLFALVAVAGWFIMLRRETKSVRTERQQ